jgi:four helix bundle protein
MTNRIPSFKDLEVWKKSMDLVRQVYEHTGRYPAEERYGPTAETRKSVRSVPANIAEGKRRFTARDYRKFVGIALGSLGELQTQVLMGSDLGYAPPSSVAELEERIEEVGRMLRGLERALDPEGN